MSLALNKPKWLNGSRENSHIMSNRIYFDNAATTAMDPRVIEKMAATMQECVGNPSSIHAEGRHSRTLIEEARKIVANNLHASLGEIFFTSGGTESNNMVLKGAVRDLGVERIISTLTEHHCVLHSLDTLANQKSAEVEYVPVDSLGNVDLSALEQMLKASTKKTLVSLMHANNEIGTLIDLEAVGNLCKEHESLFHSDTVQTVGYYPINLSELNVDFLSGSGHKFHGPKGIGFVYINGDYQLKPYIDGGSQERNMRAGTENLYGISGLGRALELAYEEIEERSEQMKRVKSYMKERLQDSIPGVRFISPENSHFRVLNVAFPPSPKSDLLLISLDIAGIAASGGSACSSGAEQGSHVLKAIQADPDYKAIRFSFCHKNTLEEVDQLVEKLQTLL